MSVTTARKLTRPEEWLEADRIIATAFLHPWNEDEARRRVQDQAAGKVARPEETWALLGTDGAMQAAITTLAHQAWFGGESVPVGEVHMVGSSMEHRGSGNVRTLMAQALVDFQERGDVFALLIPFSFAFYRKFGFELASRWTSYHIPTEQLAGFVCDYVVTKVSREEDVADVRMLSEEFARTQNFALRTTDDDWRWRGNGEFGEPDFLHPDRQTYTYVLRDQDRLPHASVRFSFSHEPDMPFFGEIDVLDLAYDDGAALLGVLGFLYRLRAKAGFMNLDLADDVDLGTILPEPDKVRRTVGGHVMARILDVERALGLMPHPRLCGSYAVGVTDAFMPQLDGTYRVSMDENGVDVARGAGQPDLELTEQTLCQLAVGLIDLEGALLRPGTHLRANEELLRTVFVRRAVHLRL